MEEITRCKQVATLTGGKWDRTIEASRRVYSIEHLAPTVTCAGGGNQEVKILEPMIVDDIYKGREPRVTDNSPTIRSKRDGLKVLEPIIYDGFNQQVRADQSCVGALTRNCGADLKRNGQGVVEPQETGVRVRKLTEKECFRLQAVKDEDYERVRKNQSKSSSYHLAGDSICTVCLMAIFGGMTGVDWRKKIDELVEGLKDNE
ncbi:MAG: hypothetical protein IJX81_01105 [Clostridia bacterium]|nr:hypothetical protein [Clostridia bacterium]